MLRGAPPCHQQNRHYCHDCHCFASSHCWGAVAEVLAGTPAVGEAVVGVVTSEKSMEGKLIDGLVALTIVN